MKFRVRVPATSANLGPGFDCLGIALSLHNELTFDTDAEPGVSWKGEGAGELPTDGSDMTSRSLARAAESLSIAVPPFSLAGVNAIPLERGLGSSSAAAVAGVLAAAALGGRELELSDAYALASEIEGHPDNAAPCVYGGLTIAGARAVRLDPASNLRPVALVPSAVRLLTSEARAALPDSVSMSDAVFNLAHSALAVVALTSDPSLLSEALQDRLHQDVRLALVPEVRDVFERLRSEGIPVCVSGAGPALMAFPQDVALPDLGSGWRVMPLEADLEGATVVPVP